MSTTQIIKWTLKKIESENLEEFAQKELETRWLTKKEYYATYLEALCDQDQLYKEFVMVDSYLYQFTQRHDAEDYDDIFFWRKNEDWTIDIITQFYNWWMSSKEAIEECINNI